MADLKAAGVSAEGEIRDANYGHIAAAILHAAQDHDARLVVLGSSSRTDLPRIPLGSVAGRLLHMATRPVLIVPRGATPLRPRAMRNLRAVEGDRRWSRRGGTPASGRSAPGRLRWKRWFNRSEPTRRQP